jgi:hypothetical protein
MQIADAVREAKENLRFLKALDASWAPLYEGDMGRAQSALPGILTSIYSMHAASRCTESGQRGFRVICSSLELNFLTV